MPYSLTLLDDKITTVSGDLYNLIMVVSGSVTLGYATESWVNQNFPTYPILTTTSGDIVAQIPSLAGYATETYVNNSINTMSGIITQYVDIKDALEADLSYVDYKIQTTSGVLVDYIDTRLPFGVDGDLLYNVNSNWVATQTGTLNGSRLNIGGGNFTGNNIFQIDSSGITNKTAAFGSSMAEFDSDDGNKSDFVFRLSGPGYPTFNLAKSNGNLVTPTTVLSTDNLGSYSLIAFDGTTWQIPLNLLGIMDGAVGAGSTPARWEFQTTPIGTATPITRMTIKSDGKVGIGTDAPSELLSVNGNLTTATGIMDTERLNSLSTDPNPITNGDRWYRTDNDFRVRENDRTLVDAVNSMAQCRQAFGITQQNCNSTGVAINWNATDVLDTMYGHSDSTNSSRITVSGTAWYKISYGVSWRSTGVARKTVVTQLRKNGTTYLRPGVAYAESQNNVDSESTNFASSLHRLTSGDYIEVIASGVGSAGTANTLQDGSTYIMVEFMRWSS